MRVLDRSDQLAEVALHLIDGVSRSVVQVRVGVLAVAGRAEGVHGELGAGEDRGHEHDLARAAVLSGRGRRERRHGAAAVAEDELQVVGMTVNLANEEGLRDFSSFRKFPNSHAARR